MTPEQSKHHKMITQYAEFASWHPEPWKYLEVRKGAGEWEGMIAPPAWRPNCEYRWIVNTGVLSYNTRLMYYEKYQEHLKEYANPAIFWKFFDLSTKQWLQCHLTPCFLTDILYMPVNSADLEVQVHELLKANGHAWCSLGSTLEEAIKNQHKVVHKVIRMDTTNRTEYIAESGYRALFAIPTDVKNSTTHEVIDNG